MSQLFKICSFYPSDASDVAALQCRAILAVSPRYYGKAELESWVAGVDCSRHIDHIRSGGGLLLARSSENLLLGFTGFIRSGEFAELKYAFTDPDAQGRGVGTALVAQVERFLRDQAVERVTVRASLSAMAFYERRGYQVTARRRQLTGGGKELDIREMEKLL